ncbi:MAG TPA: YihY/virulence factor BrkB family protein [Chitinophagaceae bacterium]|nr:YihY/virulence factor BrkB family protein [Chitinophagaceae bacterium]
MRDRLKRRIFTTQPVRSAIRQSKRTFIPGFSGFSIYQMWLPFMAQLRRTNLFERAAAISYNVVMAIPPTLIFIFTLIPYLPISKLFVQQLFALIRDVVPGRENNKVIIGFLDDFLSRPRNDLLSFGLLLAIFFSSNAMMGILRSFDRNYEGFYDPTGWQKRRASIILTFLVFILFFACVLLLIAQSNVLRWIGIESAPLRLLIQNLRWIIILLLVFYSVSSIYRHGPALLVKWPFITPGSVFATTAMFIATFLVSFWVNNFSNYNKLYGSISAVFILMLLIYVNSLVILLGFELNVTLASLKRLKEKNTL